MFFVDIYQTIRLLRPGTATGTEEVAALARLRSETSSRVALVGAAYLGELLAVVGTFSPAAVRAGLVAGSAVSLGLGEVVHVDVLGGVARDDLVPLDGLDVAEVVVVQDAHTALEDIWEWQEGENDESGG